MSRAMAFVECEEAVVALLLHEPNSRDRIFSSLEPEDFTERRTRMCFSAAKSLWLEGRAVDLVTVVSEMRSRGASDAGEIATAGDAWFGTPSAVDDYIGDMVIASARRSILTQAIHLSNGSVEQLETEEIFEDLAERLREYESRRARDQTIGIKEAVHAAFDRLDRVCSKDSPYKTGFVDFDRFAAIEPGHLTVIAGRPSMGKTSFALNIALRLSAKGVGIFLVPLETSAGDVAMSMICAHDGVDSQRIRRGWSSTEEMQRAVLSASNVAELPITICESSVLETICSEARAEARRHEDLLVIVDYLQLMKTSRKLPSRTSREQEIALFSRELKGLAKDANIPVVALSQLNRSVEVRDNKRPRLSDLRESGAIEQDADLVMMLYRDDYYDETKNPGIVELNIAKQRNGPTGSIVLVFRRSFLRFENASQQREVHWSD